MVSSFWNLTKHPWRSQRMHLEISRWCNPAGRSPFQRCWRPRAHLRSQHWDVSDDRRPGDIATSVSFQFKFKPRTKRYHIKLPAWMPKELELKLFFFVCNRKVIYSGTNPNCKGLIPTHAAWGPVNLSKQSGAQMSRSSSKSVHATKKASPFLLAQKCQKGSEWWWFWKIDLGRWTNLMLLPLSGSWPL